MFFQQQKQSWFDFFFFFLIFCSRIMVSVDKFLGSLIDWLGVGKSLGRAWFLPKTPKATLSIGVGRGPQGSSPRISECLFTRVQDPICWALSFMCFLLGLPAFWLFEPLSLNFWPKNKWLVFLWYPIFIMIRVSFCI